MKKSKKMLIIAGIVAFLAVSYLLFSLFIWPAFSNLHFKGIKSAYHDVDEEGLGAFIDERAEYWPLLLKEWEGESQTLWRYFPFKSAVEQAVFSSLQLKCIRYNGERNEFVFRFKDTFDFTISGEEELIYSPTLPIHEIGKDFASYKLNLTLTEEQEGFLRWEEGPRYFTVKEIRPDWYYIYRYWPN